MDGIHLSNTTVYDGIHLSNAAVYEQLKVSDADSVLGRSHAMIDISFAENPFITSSCSRLLAHIVKACQVKAHFPDIYDQIATKKMQLMWTMALPDIIYKIIKYNIVVLRMTYMLVGDQIIIVPLTPKTTSYIYSTQVTVEDRVEDQHLFEDMHKFVAKKHKLLKEKIDPTFLRKKPLQDDDLRVTNQIIIKFRDMVHGRFDSIGSAAALMHDVSTSLISTTIQAAINNSRTQAFFEQQSAAVAAQAKENPTDVLTRFRQSSEGYFRSSTSEVPGAKMAEEAKIAQDQRDYFLMQATNLNAMNMNLRKRLRDGTSIAHVSERMHRFQRMADINISKTIVPNGSRVTFPTYPVRPQDTDRIFSSVQNAIDGTFALDDPDVCFSYVNMLKTVLRICSNRVSLIFFKRSHLDYSPFSLTIDYEPPQTEKTQK